MKRRNDWVMCLLLTAVGACATRTQADNYLNNGGTLLSVAGSWIDATNAGAAGVPGSGDWAQFGSAAGLLGPTTFLLGGDASWLGIVQGGTGTGVTIDDGSSNLTLGAGAITVAGAGERLTMSPHLLTLGAGQTWTAGPGATLVVGGAVAENRFALAITGGGSVILDGSIGGSSGLVTSGSGALTVHAAQGYLGTTTVGGGTLMLDFSSGVAPQANLLPVTTVVTVNGAAVTILGGATAGSSQTLAGFVASTGASSVDVLPQVGMTATLSVTGSVSRTQGAANASVGGTLRFGTTGTIILSGNTNRAFLADGGGNAFVTLGLSDWAATDSTGRVMDASYVTASPTSTTNYDVTANATLGSYSAGTLRFNSSDAVTLTQSSVGTVGGILVTPNSGGALITGSTMRPAHTGTSGASLSIIQNSTTGTLTIGAGVVNSAAGVATSLVKSGAGTLVLTNSANSYTGDTFFNEGTISISASGDLGLPSTAAPLIFSGGALLATGGVTLNVTAGSGNRGITLNSGGGTLLSSSGALLTVPGVIGGSGALTIGGGTVVLSGANTYSGGTVVSGGTLVVSNTGASATGSGTVVVGGGGSISGTGSMSGAIVAGSGTSTISPGNIGTGMAGTLSAGGLSTNGNMTIAVDLGSPAKDSDVLAIAGDVTLAGGTLAVESQGSSGSASLGYYRVISYGGALTGTVRSITMPAAVGNVVYTLDVTHDRGWIDVHRGLMGDANDDGVVDGSDLNMVLQNLGRVTGAWGNGNFDGAGTVGLNDLNAVLNEWGTGVGGSAALAPRAVPEPGTVGVLIAGVGLVVRRRREKASLIGRW